MGTPVEKSTQKIPINQITVAALRNLGSSRSVLIQTLITEILDCAATNDFGIVAEYIPGIFNVRADCLSCHKVISAEWSLSRHTKQYMEKEFGPFDIDLFTIPENTQNPAFICPFPCKTAKGTNALSQDCNRGKRI